MESILAVGEEFHDIGDAREVKVPALRAAKPVTKSRRVITNYNPPKQPVSAGVDCAAALPLYPTPTPARGWALIVVRKEYAVAS